MADMAAPSSITPPTNGTIPANDAAGETVAAIAADTISAGTHHLSRLVVPKLTSQQTRSPSTTAKSAFGESKPKRSEDSHLGHLKTTDIPRIRTANILLVSIKALANEIAKNLVLAGIGSITLADHEAVTEEDLGAQFFVSDADIGKNVRLSLYRYESSH